MMEVGTFEASGQQPIDWQVIDQSWFEGLDHRTLVEQLLPHSASHIYLSRFLEQAFGLQLSGSNELHGEPLAKLLDQPKDELKALMRYCGLLMNHQKLRGVIEQAVRKKLKSILSQQELLFVFNRAPFMSRLDFEQLCVGYDDWQQLRKFSDYLGRCGSRLVSIALSETPEIYDRLSLKLPKNWACSSTELVRMQALNDQGFTNHIYTLIKKVDKEVLGCQLFSA